MEPHGVIYTKVFSADEEKDYENCELTETFILTDSSRVQFPATISLDDSDTNTRDNWRNKEVIKTNVCLDTLFN